MLEDELIDDVDLDDCVDLDDIAADGAAAVPANPRSPDERSAAPNAAEHGASGYAVRRADTLGEARILVKHPVGACPLEMWITVRDFRCRPPEVLKCFRDRLAVTPVASSRRALDGGGLVLVDARGDALPVTESLGAAGVRAGDVLMALPSLARLRFLRDELALRIDALPPLVDDDGGGGRGGAPAAGPRGGAGALALARGAACWVRMGDATWREASVALPPASAGAPAVVAWATTAMDEPPLAQVEAPRLTATRPSAMLGRPPPLSAGAPPRPLALRGDGSLVVQVVWRLGDPAEALAVWLRVPPARAADATPPPLLEAFAKRVSAERPRLRWRVVAEDLRLCALDGAPLDVAAPVASSLRALVARRADVGDDPESDRGDDLCRSWRRPGAAFEETLLALPRIAALEGDDDRGAAGDRAWIMESDGALTACGVPRGPNAPRRNRSARGGAAAGALGGARPAGGDTVLVETDRRRAGAARYRQVELGVGINHPWDIFKRLRLAQIELVFHGFPGPVGLKAPRSSPTTEKKEHRGIRSEALESKVSYI